MGEGSAIPLIEVGEAGPLTLVEREVVRAGGLIEAARKQYGALTIDVLDRCSRRWAKRLGGPYLDEVSRAARADLPTGIWFMNYAYEWGCTTSAGPAPEAEGVKLLRTLDWPFDGLGRHIVVACQQSPAGPYYNVTWPGFLGVITAMAPGRFAAAINQPPVPRRLGLPFAYPWPLDWLISRFKTFRGTRMAPSHLLRQVFEDCADYGEARERLSREPLAVPAFFTLAGVEEGEACVIERLEHEARIYRAPAAVANHWLTPGLMGRARGAESEARREVMIGLCGTSAANFDWLEAPILNKDTRLAVEANAATGRLLVQGYERDGPATEVFDLASERVH